MLDREIVGVDEHAFRAGDLVLERQDALVRARAAHGDAVRAQGQHALQGMLARRDFDHAAGLRVEELLLQGFLERRVRVARWRRLLRASGNEYAQRQASKLAHVSFRVKTTAQCARIAVRAGRGSGTCEGGIPDNRRWPLRPRSKIRGRAGQPCTTEPARIAVGVAPVQRLKARRNSRASE
jgi:hypothetical protein